MPFDPWLHGSHVPFFASLMVAALLQLWLVRALPHGLQLLRRNAMLAALCVALELAARAALALHAVHAADVLAELAVLGWGVIVLRLGCLGLFRLLAPALRLPRILQDIAFVVACLAWGLIRLRAAGLDLSGVVTTSAVITGIVAFSLQETLGNILGGLALQLDNSVRIGDWIRVDDVRGVVTEVHWRHTAVQTSSGEVVQLPNSMLMKSKVAVLSTPERPLVRRTVRFDTGLEVPPQEVIATVERAVRDAHIEYVAPEPQPTCVVTDFHEGATSYAVLYWLSDMRYPDSTDSAVRVRLHSCLQRQDQLLARPCLDVRVAQETEQAAAREQAAKVERRLAMLAGIDLFATLTREELATVAQTLRETYFPRGDVITRQGAVANWLYVLVEGEADVWFEEADAPRRHLATLQAGMVFGEMGLMTGDPRRATVTARTDASCYRIDKPSFERILRERPALAVEFAHVIDARNERLVKVRAERELPAASRQSQLLDGIRRFFGLPA